MNVNYKPFHEQLNECRANNLLLPGKTVTETMTRWKDITGKWNYGEKEITSVEIICGKFGNICSSSNKKCREMRNSM